MPNTSQNLENLVSEMRELNNKKNILGILRCVKAATNHIDKKLNDAKSGYYLLILNFNTFALNIKHYKQNQLDDAMKTYSAIENEKSKTNVNAVLVTAPSIDILKKAYPNYFSDITAFVEKINRILSLPLKIDI